MFHFRKVSPEIFTFKLWLPMLVFIQLCGSLKKNQQHMERNKVLLIRFGIHPQPLIWRLQANTLSPKKIINIMYGKKWQQA